MNLYKIKIPAIEFILTNRGYEEHYIYCERISDIEKEFKDKIISSIELVTSDLIIVGKV